MNLERISDALQNYTGQEESMHQVVAVLEEELGENWTQTVFQDLQSLPPALQNNLTNAFNYYAATMAWNETQTYLADPNLQRTPEMEERLPILQHWLDFFGAPGQEAYQELEKRLSQQETAPVNEIEEPSDDGADMEPQAEESTEEALGTSEEVIDDSLSQEEAPEGQEEIVEDSENPQEVSEIQQDEENLASEGAADDELGPNTEDEDSTEDAEELSESEDSEAETTEEGASEEETLDEESDDEDASTEEEADEDDEEDDGDDDEDERAVSDLDDDPVAFEVKKVMNQLSLLDQNQAWLAARCIQLKNIEVYAYPFYGFIVDLMRQTLKEMDEVLSDEDKVLLLDVLFEGGKEGFERKKEAIAHDIDLAEQNCESAATALVSDDMDMEEVKRTLGNIDESDTVEYVGPAPDGFELLDNDAPLDEAAIKQQYEKLENVDALTGREDASAQQSVAEDKNNTSQNEQKVVQRKLSFSLKKKKATDGET